VQQQHPSNIKEEEEMADIGGVSANNAAAGNDDEEGNTAPFPEKVIPPPHFVSIEQI
jgi:hypothetical protein